MVEISILVVIDHMLTVESLLSVSGPEYSVLR